MSDKKNIEEQIQDKTQPYQPKLKIRLMLEISGADVVLEDSVNRRTGLDMDFHIVKSYKNAPEESEITIYNMSPSTFNLIYEKAQSFRLSCARGTEEQFTPFYTGWGMSYKKINKQIKVVKNEGFMSRNTNAPDTETTIKLRSFGFGEMFKSYQDKVNSIIVIDDCRKMLGLEWGHVDPIRYGLLPKGFTISGSVQKALNLLGERFNFTCNCNDMKLNLYDKNFGKYDTYGIILNGDNSTTPERLGDKFKTETKTIQKKSKKKGKAGIKQHKIIREKQGFKLETMFLPFLQVGSTCYLDFNIADAKGEKYIYKIEHIGSNIGTICKTIIYCV